MLEGNLDKSHRQFNSHDPLPLAAGLSPSAWRRNWLKAKDEIPQIIDYICVFKSWWCSVGGVKSVTEDFQCGGFLSAQMAAV